VINGNEGLQLKKPEKRKREIFVLATSPGDKDV
jgi:hypothetical protein